MAVAGAVKERVSAGVGRDWLLRGCELLVHHWLGRSGGAVRGILLVGRGCGWKAVSWDKA